MGVEDLESWCAGGLDGVGAGREGGRGSGRGEGVDGRPAAAEEGTEGGGSHGRRGGMDMCGCVLVRR